MVKFKFTTMKPEQSYYSCIFFPAFLYDNYVSLAKARTGNERTTPLNLRGTTV
jgi:hypothetical protein